MWLFWTIYLSGYICSYLLGRYDYRKSNRQWTVGNRKGVLIFCIFSWIAFIAIFIGLENNKPAKW